MAHIGTFNNSQVLVAHENGREFVKNLELDKGKTVSN